MAQHGPDTSEINITFHPEDGCVVDVDATLSQLRHAIASLSATLIEEHPEELTAKERELLCCAIGMLMGPLMEGLH